MITKEEENLKSYESDYVEGDETELAIFNSQVDRQNEYERKCYETYLQ